MSIIINDEEYDEDDDLIINDNDDHRRGTKRKRDDIIIGTSSNKTLLSLWNISKPKPDCNGPAPLKKRKKNKKKNKRGRSHSSPYRQHRQPSTNSKSPQKMRSNTNDRSNIPSNSSPNTPPIIPSNVEITVETNNATNTPTHSPTHSPTTAPPTNEDSIKGKKATKKTTEEIQKAIDEINEKNKKYMDENEVCLKIWKQEEEKKQDTNVNEDNTPKKMKKKRIRKRMRCNLCNKHKITANNKAKTKNKKCGIAQDEGIIWDLKRAKQHFDENASLVYKMMDLLFQLDDNDISSLTNSKIKIEKEIKCLKENKGKFEKKLGELMRKDGDNYYYYKYLLTTKGQYALRSYKNIKSFEEIRKINLDKAWDRIQHRVYNKNEIEPETKALLFINWISTKNNKTEEYVMEEYKIKSIKNLCSMFYRDFDETWSSIKCLKRFVLDTFDILSVPKGLIDCVQLATALRGEQKYHEAIRLYWDVYSIGIHAMWIERYNKKASILSGDKHKWNLGVSKMNWMININEEGPAFENYDIRIPILRMAYKAQPKDITLETAMKQPWCRGLFAVASEKDRKNNHFDNKLKKWLELKKRQ